MTTITITVPAEIKVPDCYDPDDDLRDAYLLGYGHGSGIAEHNIPKLGETLDTDSFGDVTVTKDNIREIHEILCWEAEEYTRCYTPFEFITQKFNAAGERDRKSTRLN